MRMSWHLLLVGADDKSDRVGNLISTQATTLTGPFETLMPETDQSMILVTFGEPEISDAPEVPVRLIDRGQEHPKRLIRMRQFNPVDESRQLAARPRILPVGIRDDV